MELKVLIRRFGSIGACGATIVALLYACAEHPPNGALDGSRLSQPMTLPQFLARVGKALSVDIVCNSNGGDPMLISTVDPVDCTASSLYQLVQEQLLACGYVLTEIADGKWEADIVDTGYAWGSSIGHLCVTSDLVRGAAANTAWEYSTAVVVGRWSRSLSARIFTEINLLHASVLIEWADNPGGFRLSGSMAALKSAVAIIDREVAGSFANVNRSSVAGPAGR